MSSTIKLTQFSHGAGCGCKIAPAVLETILASALPKIENKNLLVGYGSKDDAAALKQKLQTNIQKNQGILQTKKAQLAQITTQIGAITSAVQVLNAQTEALSVQINENNNKQFNNLKLMDDQQRQKMFAGIDAQIKTEVDQVAGDITTLQQVVTNVSLDFIAAAASKGDADKVTNLLLNIQPATTSSG